MYTYSIMPLDTDHLDEICLDIKEQYDKNIASMPLFSVKLVPEGDPVIDKASLACEKYDLFREKLTKMGVPSGILVQCTIGHGYVLSQMFPFTQYENLTDGEKQYICCPYDERLQDYFRDQFRTVASHSPDMIMVDDDFRLMARDGKGCACPLHMAEIGKRCGEDLTREQLKSHLENEDADGRYTKIFVDTQRESLIRSAKAMRAGIDDVDAHLPGSFCCCGEHAEFAGEIAKILAGDGNPVIIRVNNGNYTPEGARYLSRVSMRAACNAALIKKDADVLLAETDTCPQNRYSTGAASLHSHYTATILEGAAGAKHWITRMAAYEPKSGEAYRKKLAQWSGFYEALAGIVPDLEWKGCRIPVSPRADLSYFSYDLRKHPNTWGYKVLERMGLPMYFSPAPSKLSFIDGDGVKRFTDSQITEMLSGCCVMSSYSAKILIDRGYSDLLGVDVREWQGRTPSFEIINATGQHCSLQKDRKEIVPLHDTVEWLSTVCHLHNGVDVETLFPGCTVYSNRLSGKAVVFCGTTDTEFNYTQAFSFLNYSRKRQLIDILRPTGEIPVYYPDDAEVYLRAANMPDGSLFCALFNIGLDDLDDIPLVISGKVSGIEMLMPDGSRKSCDFSTDGDRVVIKECAKILHPVILFVR